MQFSVNRETLSSALDVVSSTVSTRPTLPVLSNVLLRIVEESVSGSGVMELVTTNLEQSIVVRIGVRVQRGGEVTLPFRTLSDVVKRLRGDILDVTVDLDRASAVVKCGKQKVEVKGITATEYPMVAVNHELPRIAIGEGLLKSAISRTVYAAAKDDTRPVLTGILLDFSEGALALVAADGYRLALVTIGVEHDFVGRQPVVPAATLRTVAKVAGDNVELALDEEGGKVAFFMGNVTLISQTLSGRFPDFTRIIPKTCAGRAHVDVSDALDTIALANVYSADDDYSVKLSFVDMGIEVYAKSAERGHFDGQFEASVNSELLGESISCNGVYLAEMLSAYKGLEVELEYKDATSALVLRHGEQALSLIAPMRPPTQ